MKLKIYTIITVCCCIILTALITIAPMSQASPTAEPKAKTVKSNNTKPVQQLTVSEKSKSQVSPASDNKAEEANASEGEEESSKHNGETNLPVPRFVSIKSDEVNVRAGPGNNYPIKWVIIKKDLPVEIVQEFEYWRKIRDNTGDEAWVHGAMLSGNRTAIIQNKTWDIKSDEDPKSKTIATVEKGVIVHINECDLSYCKVRIDHVSGYIVREALWGLYKNEIIKD